MAGGDEKARKVRRKSLEWGFARKSGGQYGVSKLRGWRKEFYCEFRWRIFSHGWHEYTTRGCSCLCCTNQTATHPTECTEHTEPSAERDSHGWHGWTQMLGCAGMNNGLNGLNGFGRFVFNRLRLNMCCCVLRRQDTSATDGCSENQINQINPL